MKDRFIPGLIRSFERFEITRHVADGRVECISKDGSGFSLIMTPNWMEWSHAGSLKHREAINPEKYAELLEYLMHSYLGLDRNDVHSDDDGITSVSFQNYWTPDFQKYSPPGSPLRDQVESIASCLLFSFG